MELIVLCGASGSGKTTLSKEMAKEYKLVRISMDEMKLFLHSDLLPMVAESLKKSESLVVDALYTKLKWRMDILEATKDFQGERILIYLNTSLDECLRRNSERENAFPDFVIKDIYNSIEPPSLDEGWDKIIYVKEGENIEVNFTSD